MIGKTQSDAICRFWRAFGIAQEGNYTEAIREFKPLQQNRVIALATTAALINTHKLCRIKDKDELAALKDNLKELSKTSGEDALIFAARYFWHADKPKQSRKCIEKVLGDSRKNIDALTLFGWINLTSNQPRYERKSVQFFDTSLKMSEAKKDLGALLGRAEYNERKQKFDRVLEDLNQVIVLYPDFLPGLVEKARVLMVMGNWEEALATAHRVIAKDAHDIGALKILVLYLLSRESKPLVATNRINDLHEAINRYEPGNAKLYYDVSRLCARLSNRRHTLLQLTMSFVDTSCKLDPLNSQYMTEQAYQLMLLGDYDQAYQYNNEASKLDEQNIAALQGRIRCKIYQGNYSEAEQELEFLAEIQNSLGDMQESTDIYFLQAMIAWKKEKNEEKSLTLLNDAITEHLKLMESVKPGFDFYIAYNPDFILEIAKEFMKHISNEPMHKTDPPNDLLKKVG